MVSQITKGVANGRATQNPNRYPTLLFWASLRKMYAVPTLAEISSKRLPSTAIVNPSTVATGSFDLDLDNMPHILFLVR